MDIYDFINSRDIQKHLQEINYNISPPESAYIVWQSKRHTIEEKHKAYREIIKQAENCEILLRRGERRKVPLSDYLFEYIAIENELICCFHDNTNSVYSYEIDSRTKGALYPNKEMCIAAMKQGSRNGKGWLIKYLLATKSTDIAKNIKLQTNENGECIFVSEHSFLSENKKKVFDAFGNMHFDIPVPFVEWDFIVEKYGETETPFFYRPSEIVYNPGDMSALCLNEDEACECIIIDNYLDLEYFYDGKRLKKATDEDLPF